MDLQYDTEQTILRESAGKFLADRYDSRAFRGIVGSDERWSTEMWAAFAEMGWLGLPFAEDDGGFGMGPVEVAILMEEFGKALVLEPYVPTVVLCGELVARLGIAEQRRKILAEVAAGEARLAFAHMEMAGDASAPATATTTTTATADGDGVVLRGAKKAVLAAPMADLLLVSAVTDDGATAVFGMPAKLKGITQRAYFTVDGGRAADIEFSEVKLPAGSRLGEEGDAAPAIEAALAAAIAATSAEAVGAMTAMVDQTVDYARQREQFGQSIAKFQVLQHRMVDMKVAAEEARGSALLATLSLEGPKPMRDRAVSGAKAKVGRAARFVHQAAIQTHGAIGTTDELVLGWYAKRLMAYEINYGSTRAHLGRYGELIADADVAAAPLMLEPA